MLIDIHVLIKFLIQKIYTVHIICYWYFLTRLRIIDCETCKVAIATACCAKLCWRDGVLCKVVLPRRRVVQSCVGATVCCAKLCQVSATACCVFAWRCVVHSCVNATARLFKRYVALTQMALSGHHTFQRVFANRNVFFHWKREKKTCREDTGGGLRGGGLFWTVSWPIQIYRDWNRMSVWKCFTRLRLLESQCDNFSMHLECLESLIHVICEPMKEYRYHLLWPSAF